MILRTYDNEIKDFPQLGEQGSQNSYRRVSWSIDRVPFFYGSYNWFSAPSNFAHLGLVKEQSREIIRDGRLVAEQSRKRVLSRLLLKADNNFLAISEDRPVVVLPSFFKFPKTSIKQFLTVLAMSTLTTSDLEITSIRIVTPVADHLSVNTAGEVLSGEETLVCERPMNFGGSF